MQDSPRSVAALPLLYGLTFLYVGAHANFLPLWLREAGWSEPQIGWLDGLKYACVLVFPLLWGRVIDRRGEAIGVLRMVAFGSLVAFLPLLFTSGFWPVIIAMTIWAAFRTAVIPTLDAITLSRIRRVGGEYGRYRSWGSAGFILGSLGLGLIVDATDRDIIPWSLAVILAATWLLVVLMRREDPGDNQPRPTLGAIRALLARRPVRAVYGAAFASRFAMHGLYGFLPLHLQDLGVPDWKIPVYWAIGVLSEILLIRNARHLFLGRWSTRVVLSLCFAAAVIQYALTALTDDPDLLLPIMLLHGVTFGVWYVASMVYLGEQVGHEERATAQALFQTASFGLGGTLSAVAAGYLYAAGQGPLMFGCGAAAAVLACVWTLWRFPDG